jgi:manganese oxidase
MLQRKYDFFVPFLVVFWCLHAEQFTQSNVLYFKFRPWFDMEAQTFLSDKEIETRITQTFKWFNYLKKRKHTVKYNQKAKPIFSHKWKHPDIPISLPPPLMGIQMGSVETPGIPPIGYELDGAVKVFHLIAQPVEKYLTDGKKPDYYDLVPEENRVAFDHHHPKVQKIKCWGYNGTTPGPTIEAYEGDRIRIILKNELPEPTSIHWHGLEVPNAQDGATPETARPAMPGETIVYEFTLYQSGTIMYHSGYNIMKQDHYGLEGAFVIHPQKYERGIDRDIVIFLQQFTLLPGNKDPNLVSNQFNWFTFNGFSSPSIPKITINQGERVRIRFANTIMDPHPIHIHGYVWEEVGTEGGPIPPSARRKGSTIPVPAGTTRDVEFVAWNPGLWRLHCHMLHHVVNAHTDIPMGIMQHQGMFTLIHVIPKDPNAPWQHPRGIEFEGGL